MQKASSSKTSLYLRGLLASLIDTTFEKRLITAILMALALLAIAGAAVLMPNQSQTSQVTTMPTIKNNRP